MDQLKADLWKWRWHLIVFGGAILISGLILFNVSLPAAPPSTPPATWSPVSFSLPPDALLASAAIVYDPVSDQILFNKHANQVFPLASLTKIMAADVVLARENPQTPVTITEDHTSEINDQGDLGFKVGQEWSLGELVRYGLFASSNNAMLAAAAATTGLEGTSTVTSMNERAAELGLQAHFYNPTGLDISDTLSGGYGSARDIAVIAADFYKNHPSFFETTMRSDAQFGPDGQEVEAEPTAAPLEDIAGVLAAKTGYTDLAQGNVVAIFEVNLNHPLVAVVLHSTEKGRFDDIRKLIAAAREAK